MPLLIVLLPLLFQIGSQLLNGVNSAASGKYNKALQWLSIAALLYFLVSAVSKSKQQAYLNNAGQDVTTQQAQALRDAFNRSGVSYLMAFDGTDTDLVFQTAAQITDYKAVSEAYRVLYPGSELTTDLQTELSRTDLQKFWNTVYRTPGTTGSTTTTPSLVGRTVQAIQLVNVRTKPKPTVVDHQAKAGQTIGTYVSEADLTINGKKDRFILVSVKTWALYSVEYYVHKGSCKIL